MTNLAISNKSIGVLLSISIAFAVATAIILLWIPPSDKMMIVNTGSMCVPYDGACTGRLSPSEPTLHVGDHIVIQPVDPRDLSADYPNSDIIVFHNPSNPDELIVHRIVQKEERNGVLYFWTEGDGIGLHKYPDVPDQVSDPWSPFSQDLIVGKVVNTNYPYDLMSTAFWISLAVSIAIAVAALVLLVFQRTLASYESVCTNEPETS